MRFHVITCDMLIRPMEHLEASSTHQVDISDLSASLHAEPVSLRARIQAQIDRIEAESPSVEAEGADVDAVLLGYGLCGGATAGLAARTRPLVVPRAHDCATILLGSRERYRREHDATPGTYWFTEDNIERGDALRGWLLGDAARSDEVEATYRGYVDRYGEDNADYLMETLGEWQTRYERGAFLDTGLPTDGHPAGRARQESGSRGWRFERVLADLTLIERLLGGEWDDDFVVVPPGGMLAISYDEDIVRSVPAATVVEGDAVVDKSTDSGRTRRRGAS